MKKFLLLLVVPLGLWGQASNPGVLIYGTPPSGVGGACVPGVGYLDVSGTVYTCQSSVWAALGGGGGSGTVTSIATNNGITGGTITTSGTIGLASISANTLLGALTATTPSGLAVPSCSAAGNALNWTSGTGFGCGTGFITGLTINSTAISGSSANSVLYADGSGVLQNAVSVTRTAAGTLTFGTSIITPKVTATGSILFLPGSDSTTAMQFGNAAGTAFVTMDSTNQTLALGTTTAGTNRLTVSQIGSAAGLIISGGTNPQMTLTDGTIIAKIQVLPSASTALFGTQSNHPMDVYTNNLPVARFATSGDALIGGTTDSNYRLDVQKSGSSGTARFFDQTVTTGATSVVIQAGAGDASGAKLFRGFLNDGTTEKWSITRDGAATFAGALAVTGTITGTSDITAGNVGAVYWSGRSVMTSPTNGNIKLSNLAQSDFGLLLLGGTTSSFPALKRSSAKIQVRLADDSAAGTIESKYNSSDGTAGVTVTTCTGFKDGLCISGT